ncbi:phospholipase D-like domain-containing protein [Parabacteroides johnsonii]|uniref:phospholipase D-like domain-containing protein n=1 Tax=Parabacteroides johnsonii TaxID=387661 RepID=UPI0016524747|nr:phospholipase D-like domain-containing protein [Parabacteroides johnsonii]
MKTNVYFQGIQEQIIKHINKAEYEIIIAVAWFTDPVIINALYSKIKKDRIDVRILIYDDKINKKDWFFRLYNSGAKIRFSESMMHNKFCIIDTYTVINGSYNWTQKANHNNENIQISYDNEVLSSAFIKEFNRLFSRATSYEHYIIRYENARDKILYHLNSFLPQYKQLFKKPDKFPCFIVLHNSGFWIQEDKKINLVLGRRKGEEYIYILIKNEFCWNSIIEELFMLFVESTLRVPRYFTKEERAKEYSKISEKIKGIEDFINNPISMYNESICSKLLLNVYGVNKEHISDNEFTINSLICHYIYLEHKEKFIATKLNLDKNCRIKGDEKDDLIGFINLDGVLEKTITNNIDHIIEKDNEYLFDKYTGIIYILDNYFTEIKIPRSYIPDSLICNHIIIKKPKPYSGNKSWYYNIMDYSGKLYFINDNKYEEHYYHHFCDYIVKNNDLVEFKWDGCNANVTIDLRTGTILDPSNILDKQKEEITQIQRDIERDIERNSQRNNCYIATMVYKDIYHPKVCILRTFRDRTLINYKIGRLFISYYYKHSPSWVEFLRDKKIINSIIKFILNRLVFMICFLYRTNYNSIRNNTNK